MNKTPIVYSCSGCSNVAQLANALALYLDRENLAEMSCIAGVGGNVPALVKVAKTTRKKIVIDGCPMACGKSCLNQLNLAPDLYIELFRLGFKKRKGVYFDDDEFESAKQYVLKMLDNQQADISNKQKK